MREHEGERVDSTKNRFAMTFCTNNLLDRTKLCDQKAFKFFYAHLFA